MRQHLIATGLLLITSMPALGQNLDALRDGLDHLPATAMLQQHGDLAYFVDVKALSDLANGDSAVQPFARVMVGADINALESFATAEPADWEGKAGTTRDAVRYFTGYGRTPGGVSFWGLTDAAAATEMIATLGGMGFEDAGKPGVIGNGEPMQMDLQKRDPSDPWRTMIGAAQFAAAKGSTVVQAQNPQDAMLVAAQQASLGESPILQTALSGLQQSAGDNRIVQAVVISPLFGMAGLDPSAFLSPSGDMTETRQQIEGQMAELASGIPAYLGGIVADMQGEKQGVGIALAYPDCTIAQVAADRVAERWIAMAGDAAEGDILAQTAPGEAGLCAATVSIHIDADNPEQNPAYRAVIDAHLSSRVGVLQIGTN